MKKIRIQMLLILMLFVLTLTGARQGGNLTTETAASKTQSSFASAIPQPKSPITLNQKARAFSNLVSSEFQKKWNVKLVFIDNPNLGVDCTFSLYRQITHELLQSGSWEAVGTQIKKKWGHSFAVLSPVQRGFGAPDETQRNINFSGREIPINSPLDKETTQFLIGEVIDTLKS